MPDTLTIPIPESIRVEHTEIHDELVAATQAPGRVGEAARAVATVLHPHFVREEEIALPPLALLAPLSRGERPEGMAEALLMADSLRTELPRMLEEHVHIREAVERLAQVSREERAERFVALAERLRLHAQNEEEVLYPAAVLVGDLIRSRLATPRP